MKKFLTWLAVGVMACGISFGAFANGPLLGVSVSTVPASPVNLMVGWDFGPLNLEFTKANFTTPVGPLNSTLLWTPMYDNGFGYRAGGTLQTRYTAGGAFTYRNAWFIFGLSQNIGPFQLYGEAQIRAAGALAVFPVIGVNFLFGDLFPVKNTVE